MQYADHWHRLLRARRERPRGCPAEKRDELAPFHCPMSPVLPTGRIAHLGSADCCIHPPGRNETIGVTPPIIFSKGGSSKQATPLPRQVPSPEIVSDQISGDGAWMNFRFSRVLPPGGSTHPTLAAGAAASRPRWQPPSVDHAEYQTRRL